METFNERQKKLIDMILRHEGGYVNDAADKGKETYCGISRVYHPDWNGWKYIDKHKPLKRNQKINDTDLQNSVYDFYYNKFYKPLMIDSIDNITIGGHLLCHGVNAGLARAIKIVQKAINSIYSTNISVDGKIGKVTLSYLNRIDKQDELVTEIINQRNRYYKSIVDSNPSQSKFLTGWYNRVNGTTLYCNSLKNTSPIQLGFVSTEDNSQINWSKVFQFLSELVKFIVKFLKK